MARVESVGCETFPFFSLSPGSLFRENSLSAFLKGCEINLEFNFMLLILSVQVLNGGFAEVFLHSFTFGLNSFFCLSKETFSWIVDRWI